MRVACTSEGEASGIKAKGKGKAKGKAKGNAKGKGKGKATGKAEGVAQSPPKRLLQVQVHGRLHAELLAGARRSTTVLTRMYIV